jgi:hypothetical protein
MPLGRLCAAWQPSSNANAFMVLSECSWGVAFLAIMPQQSAMLLRWPQLHDPSVQHARAAVGSCGSSRAASDQAWCALHAAGDESVSDLDDLLDIDSEADDVEGCLKPVLPTLCTEAAFWWRKEPLDPLEQLPDH